MYRFLNSDYLSIDDLQASLEYVYNFIGDNSI